MSGDTMEDLDFSIPESLVNMVKTPDLKMINRVLEINGWATICGIPGSGKTTLALQTANTFLQKGYTVKMIPDLETFQYNVFMNPSEPLLLVFDDVCASSCTPSVQSILSLNNLNTLENLICHKHSKHSERGSELITSHGSYGKDKNRQADVKILFTATSKQVYDAMTILPKFKHSWFKESTLVNITTSFPVTEDIKQSILQTHLKEELVTAIINDGSIPESADLGFPLSCVIMNRFKTFQENSAEFLQDPLKHMVSKVQTILEDKECMTVLLLLMALNDNKLSLNDVRKSASKITNQLNIIATYTDIDMTEIVQSIQKTAEDVKETFFTVTSNDEIQMVSTSLFSVLIYCIGIVYPRFLIDQCPLNILMNRMKLSVNDDDKYYVKIQDMWHYLIIQRFTNEIVEGNFNDSVDHSSWECPHIARSIIKELQKGTGFNYLTHSQDSKYGLHFLFWAARCPSTELLQEALETEYFSIEEKMEGIISCCISGNIAALKVFLHASLLDSIICHMPMQNKSRNSIFNKQTLQKFSGTNDKPIHIACKYGHTDIVLKILNDRGDIESRGSRNMTPLLAAVAWAHSTLSKILINEGADTTAVDSNGQNSLHIACHLGLEELVIILLKDININVPDKNNNTCLHLAFSGNNRSIVSKLLEHNIDINVRGHGLRTPLMEASKCGLTDLVNLLLQQGADSHLTDEHGDNSLLIACENGHLDVVKVLLQSGLDINGIGKCKRTPLMAAVISSSFELVEYLITEGATTAHTDVNGINCLMLACAKGCTDIAMFLTEHGMDVNDKGQTEFTPLLYACFSGSGDLVDSLIVKGADVQFTDTNQNNCMLLASQGMNTDVVQKLLEIGVDVDSPNKWEWTPLLIASQSGSAKLVQQLLDNGATVEEDGSNSLVLTCLNGHLNTVDVLFAAGVDVNCKSSWDQTPLSAACQSESKELIKILIDKEANISETDHNGNNCLIVACERGKKDVALQLLNAGLDINCRGCGGQTPLMAAAHSGNADLVNTLIKLGAVVDIVNEENNNSLMIACAMGHKDIAIKLLHKGLSINSRGHKKQTPLMLAVLSSAPDFTEHFLLMGETSCEASSYLIHTGAGNADLVEYLIEQGADMFMKDDDGNNCLILACAKGYLDITLRLLQYGLDINGTGSKNITPLMAACQSGCLPLIDFLIENDADVYHIDDEENNCLMAACMYGQKQVAVKLIAARFDVNYTNKKKQTPIMLAVLSGSVETVEYLIKMGADPYLQDENESNCLILSCQTDKTVMVMKILEYKIDINARGNESRTPLMVACSSGSPELVHLLIARGANMYLTDRSGLNCFAMSSCNTNCSAVMKELLDSGYGVNTQGNEDQTPLIEASLTGLAEVVENLIKFGAHTDLRDKENNNALIAACSRGHLQVAAKLIESGQDINCRGQWDATPLIIASICGNAELVEMLIASGADLKLTDESGINALISACAKGKADSVAKLVEYGADVNSKGGFQWTPLLAACWNGCCDVVDFLLLKGARLDLYVNYSVKCLTVALENGNGEVAGRLLESVVENLETSDQ